ncbi:MAG: hypothetical protein ACRBCL_01805 [Maritimibacter sp.]
MNAYVGEIATTFDEPALVQAGSPRSGPVILAEPWGYTVRNMTLDSPTQIVTLAAARFFGVILMIASVGLWVAPGVATGLEFAAMKLGASVAFVLLGGALFWRGRDEGGLDVQVDTSRGEFRLGTRNAKGQFVSRGMIPFGEVSSLYLAPETDENAAGLYLRMREGKRGVEIAQGGEPALSVLEKRIEMDLAQSQNEMAPFAL